MIRRLALALTVMLLVAACQAGDDGGDDGDRAAASQSSAAAPREGVTVTGLGRVPGEPDTLRATVGVQVARQNIDEAFDDAAAAAEQVLDAIREQGVDNEDIQTRDFSVRPDHEPPRPPDGPPGPPGPPEVSGYVVRNIVEVTVRDVDQAGELLAAVTDAAGDDARVEGLRFSLEDDDELVAAARADALDDARSKAEHYAELVGAELGELVSVTEVGGPHPPPAPAAPEAIPPEGAIPPILPGEQEVGVQVRATWALQ